MKINLGTLNHSAETLASLAVKLQNDLITSSSVAETMFSNTRKFKNSFFAMVI